jgi:hypothetical protein
VPTRRDWEARRTEVCRLSPAFALDTTDDALEFLADRQLLTLTASSALPSLFGACHEEPYAPGKGGYGRYPKTRWWWGGWLADEPGVVTTKLAKGRQLFLDRTLAEAISALPCRDLARAEAGELGDDAAALVALLAERGVTNVDDVKAALGWDAARLRRVRTKVERTGSVLASGLREDLDDGGHRHSAELRRWDDAMPATTSALPDADDMDDALAALVVAGVRAAVIAPEAEVRRWFSWPVATAMIERLVDEQRVLRVEDALATAG